MFKQTLARFQRNLHRWRGTKFHGKAMPRFYEHQRVMHVNLNKVDLCDGRPPKHVTAGQSCVGYLKNVTIDAYSHQVKYEFNCVNCNSNITDISGDDIIPCSGIDYIEESLSDTIEVLNNT